MVNVSHPSRSPDKSHTPGQAPELPDTAAGDMHGSGAGSGGGMFGYPRGSVGGRLCVKGINNYAGGSFYPWRVATCWRCPVRITTFAASIHAPLSPCRCPPLLKLSLQLRPLLQLLFTLQLPLPV